eukprot:scaffold44470_cov61-Phaeocystis_antarctica.AAC.3
MCDEPIGLDGALAAPPTRSAAPIISSSSWLEQQELAEVLEEQLTGLEAIEVAFEEAMETSEATEEAIKETSMEAGAIGETVEETIEDFLADF